MTVHLSSKALKFRIICLSLVAGISLYLEVVAAHPATGIVVDHKGNVYFSDLETVWRLTPQGELNVFRAGVSGRHVHELSIDKDDNIYGADSSYESQKWISAVWKMTPAGQFTYLSKPSSKPPRGMSIWLDQAGNMYFVEQDNRRKTETLLLRRSPDNKVTTLAGGAYGHLDGRGAAARFSSVGGMAFGPKGDLYLTDGTTVRKVSPDGTVTTVADDLIKRSVADRPPLFGKNDGILSGLSVDAAENVYLADAGNQRLLKITRDGEVNIVYRGDPPYYPNGVVATKDGELYVLEVGYTPPSQWLSPRVRKIDRAGKSAIVAVTGDVKSAAVQLPVAVAPGETGNRRSQYTVVLAGVVIVGLTFVVWKLRRRVSDAVRL